MFSSLFLQVCVLRSCANSQLSFIFLNKKNCYARCILHRELCEHMSDAAKTPNASSSSLPPSSSDADA